MDTTQYLDVFIDESREHLEVLSNQLLALEKHPQEKEIVEEIFRAAHTLKGMSATMGYHDLSDLTHRLENVLDGIRSDKITVDASLIDVLFNALDHLESIIEDIERGGSGNRDITETVARLERIEKGEKIEDEKEQPTEELSMVLDEFEQSILNEAKERGFANYEITVQLRKDCLLKGARVFMVFDILEKHGEVIKSTPSVTDLEEENFDNVFSVIFVSTHAKEELETVIKQVAEIEHVAVRPFTITVNEKQKQSDKLKAEQAALSDQQGTDSHEPARTKNRMGKTIRVNIERLDALMNLFEELVIDRSRLEQIAHDLNHQELQETVEHMSRVSSDLQNIILTMRMVPIEQVFNRFPRMIRQLARELNKQVEIDIIGADTELDRTVIDEIGDPLIHLVRNAMDHGIETPEERRQKGKPEQGTIVLQAYHSGNHVFIQISDDGAGINRDKVLAKAIENGVINEEEGKTLTDKQIYELIMASGFSTADRVSDISGRGVGLDVVKNTIESLGGRITVDAKPDHGSTFLIQLPLTLSIMSVLLVKLNDETYAIPLSSIMETVVVHRDNILHAHHKKVIDFRGNVVPLVFLNDIFQTGGICKTNDDYFSIVVVRKGEQMTGLVVDSFIGQQEVVLKSLGNYLTNVFAILGATILGDGQVVLIIDSNAFVK
ncbi:MAG TPA: chemotaxis protein CheA [Bacillota bacterium]|nr:chemotaxis protein CheA [Bacillota bacterium]